MSRKLLKQKCTNISVGSRDKLFLLNKNEFKRKNGIEIVVALIILLIMDINNLDIYSTVLSSYFSHICK